MHIDNNSPTETQRETSLITDALVLGAFGAGMLAGRWYRNRKKRCTGRCQTAPTPTPITPAVPSTSAPSATTAAEPSSGVPIAIVDAPATESAPRGMEASDLAAETASAPADASIPRTTSGDEESERPRIADRRATFSIGALLKAGMETLAALQPLPAAPTGSGMLTVDVENLVTYQGALATAAKRDEQIRALGSLLAGIIK